MGVVVSKITVHRAVAETSRTTASKVVATALVEAAEINLTAVVTNLTAVGTSSTAAETNSTAGETNLTAAEAEEDTATEGDSTSHKEDGGKDCLYQTNQVTFIYLELMRILCSFSSHCYVNLTSELNASWAHHVFVVPLSISNLDMKSISILCCISESGCVLMKCSGWSLEYNTVFNVLLI